MHNINLSHLIHANIHPAIIFQSVLAGLILSMHLAKNWDTENLCTIIEIMHAYEAGKCQYLLQKEHFWELIDLMPVIQIIQFSFEVFKS